MPFPSTLQLAATNAILSIGYIVLGGYTWRRYNEIGSRSFSLFAGLWGVNFLLAAIEVFTVASYGVTSGTELASLTVPANVRLMFIIIAPFTEIFTVVAIYVWLWFVLGYTTRMDRQDKIAVGAIAGGLIFITVLSALVGVLTTFEYLQLPNNLENSFHVFATILEILGTGVAVGAGIAQLFRTAQRHTLFKHGAVPALSVAVLLPYLIRYIYRLGFIPQFRTIELLRFVGLGIGLLGLWIAVEHYEIFQQLPASQTVGRDTAIDNVETAIALLNRQDNVTDLNPAGEALFGVSTPEIIGKPVSALLPDTIDHDVIQNPGVTTFEFPDSDRIVQAETAITIDDSDREIGRTIVFNDITDERRRQQRIEVLNRVLRHNLRNDVSVATGYLEAIAEGDVSAEEYAPRIQSTLDGLVTIGSKARKIEDMLAAEPTIDSAIPLSRVVQEALDSLDDEYDTSAVTTEIPDAVVVRANPQILEPVIAELVENALEHADADSVTVAFDPHTQEFSVTDPGPGIPDHEIEVFESGEETELEHGSGLGLWLVKWGVDRIGGTVDFETDTGGTRVVVSLPANLISRAA